MHTGIDLTAPRGSSIYVTGNGKVVKAGWGNGYGNMIVVDHGFSYKTIYAHLSKIDVKEGQQVRRGQVIGRVGSTGTSTCNHLHYEVRINDVPRNPLNFYSQSLTDEQYDQMLAVEGNEPLSDI